jgi:hypothetical protein
LEVCAADLVANHKYRSLGCALSATEVIPPSTVELEVFAVDPSVVEIDEYQKSIDPCYLHNLPKVKKDGVVISKEWTVNADEWRRNAVVHMGPNATSAQTDMNCMVKSADISVVINEVLQAASWEFGRSITVLVQDKANTAICMNPGNATQPAITSPVISGTDLVDALKLASTSFCKTIETIKNKLNDRFPLWVTPYEDATVNARAGAQLASLNVAYCLNPECVSPQFLGAGADVELGGKFPDNFQEAAYGVGATASSSLRGRRLATRAAGATHVSQAPAKNIYAELRESGADKRALTSHSPPKSQIEIGELQLTGLPQVGMLYGLTYVPRAMTAAEVQTNLYSNSKIVTKLGGPMATVQKADTSLSITQFPQEVVAVMPPVVLQARAPTIECSEQISELANDLDGYLSSQLQRKCAETYSCNTMKFVCVDRDGDNMETDSAASPSTLFFSRESIEAQGVQIQGSVSPEFLDTLTIPVVYKDGQIMESSNYIDLQTKEISVLSVLLAAPPIRYAGRSLFQLRRAGTHFGKLHHEIVRSNEHRPAG